MRLRIVWHQPSQVWRVITVEGREVHRCQRLLDAEQYVIANGVPW